MPAGSIQSVVVCIPGTTATTAQRVTCPVVGGQIYVPSKVQAYLLDPAQQAAIDASLGPFDYGYAAGLWATAFTMVVGLYFVSNGIGTVLGMIRRG